MSTVYFPTLTLRMKTRLVVLDGERTELHIVQELSSKLQDPDTPQREAAQVRASLLADNAFFKANVTHHQENRIGYMKPVLAIHGDDLVVVKGGFLTRPYEIRRIGTVDYSTRPATATRTCTCRRPERHGLTCRCTCDKCGSKNLQWKAWGAYLDKDLICQGCGHEQDDWGC